ncbi:cytochrome P450 [Xylariaceae sp. FL1272]|nr:cytochrome P450 [Xylariaceae sp. FL1272]
MVIRYTYLCWKYNDVIKNSRHGQNLALYPAVLPYLGNVFPLVCHTASAVSVADGQPTTTAISFLGATVCILQDRATIVKFLRHSKLSSPIDLYVYTQKHLFGMPRKALASYQADDSGPHAVPFTGTNVQFRIDHILHKSFLRAWSGPRLQQTSRRYVSTLETNLANLETSPDSWVEVPDLFKFFLKPVSASITETVFGKYLLDIFPSFLDDLWIYDDMLPWIARGVPSYIFPGPYRFRQKLLQQLKNWQVQARATFDQSMVEGDSWEPNWGSELVRDLQTLLAEQGTHDEDGLASHHLGLIFAANFNLVPSTLVMALNIIQDPLLLQRVREEINTFFPRGLSPETADLQRISELPLLSSIYAESLRLYVKVFFFASSARADIILGKWKLPKGTLAVVNTDGPHTRDQGHWNTMRGKRPLDMFWAERFIVHPSDPDSGPVNPDLPRVKEGAHDAEPSFSTAGLDGAWIPYGGGSAICPGRFLAKFVIMYSCAMIVQQFDFQVTNTVDLTNLDDWRYGLGIVRPKSPMSVLLRRR